tara:strand:+ start:243 stop:374 length:132 start_codon:yes stop_codon:yes gene_type:complete
MIEIRTIDIDPLSWWEVMPLLIYLGVMGIGIGMLFWRMIKNGN